VVALCPDATAQGTPGGTPASAPRPRLTLLGGFGLHVGHDEVHLSPSPQRLLALLGLHERALRRGYVAGLLWGDSTETHASGCLRSALWKLRMAKLSVVQTIGDSLTLSPDICVDVNYVTSLTRTVISGSFGEEALALLEPCFSAELLPGWHDEWVLGARERHRQLSLHALESLCEYLTTIGRYGAAALAGLTAVDREPLRESAHRALMKVHIAEGNAAEAIRRYQQYEAIAARDLGIGPSAIMRSLFSQIATV
jgi:DNA-binding SARP family transcriptional activator